MAKSSATRTRKPIAVDVPKATVTYTVRVNIVRKNGDVANVGFASRASAEAFALGKAGSNKGFVGTDPRSWESAVLVEGDKRSTMTVDGKGQIKYVAVKPPTTRKPRTVKPAATVPTDPTDADAGS